MSSNSTNENLSGSSETTNDKNATNINQNKGNLTQPDKNVEVERQQWTNELEFLFSCISMSVGLGL
jgi:hypothetical protein